jgi:hypothetical protein
MALASSLADRLGMQTRFDTLPLRDRLVLVGVECTFRSRHLRRVPEQGFMCRDVLAMRRMTSCVAHFPGTVDEQ